MSQIRELFESGRHEELWQLCCGFLDLSVDQFMQVQRNLLLEQIPLLNNCELGNKIMRGAKPGTVEEFRAQVPLTTYKDYCPELVQQREDVLPAKPLQWVLTTGVAGEYTYKRIPISQRFWDEAGLAFTAGSILSTCHRKGDISLKKNMKILYAAAPAPYLTSAVAQKLSDDLGFNYMPEMNESQELDFEARVGKGFNQALSLGMDGVFGLGGALVAIGQKLKQDSGKSKKSKYIKQPRALLRLTRAVLRSRRAGRSPMPKDLWKALLLVSMGNDSLVYNEKITELWGRTPLTVYGNTETSIMATQTWDYRNMVFFPNLHFLEFIPEEEYSHSQIDKNYRPKTVLLDEVKPDRVYELVVTNFHGGPMTRYRVGDLIRVVSLRNAELGIELPQILVEGRADDLIDLGGLRLTERVIWQALENTGIPHKGWTARKEIKDTPRLRLFLELAPGYHANSEDVADRLYQAIKRLDNGLYAYKEISSYESFVVSRPIDVTILAEGVFSGYKKIRQAAGASMTDLKPPHVNPSEEDLALLEGRQKSLLEEWAEAALNK
jgi:hypothetical protein